MLNRLKRWLGWGTDSGLLDFSDFSDVKPSDRGRPSSRRPSPKPPLVVANRSGGQRQGVPTPPPTASPATAQRRAKAERAPTGALDKPRLSLDKPVDDGFDPYNTGAFNRSASWERIGRQRKR